jgi:cell division protein FtsW (lipid II flippase)
MIENTYQSKDFYLSGYLLAIQLKLLSHTRDNRITTFIFQDNDELQDAVNKYYNMSAIVNPVIYGQSLRSLKSLIHSNHTNTDANTRTTEKGFIQ